MQLDPPAQQVNVYTGLERQPSHRHAGLQTGLDKPAFGLPVITPLAVAPDKGSQRDESHLNLSESLRVQS